MTVLPTLKRSLSPLERRVLAVGTAVVLHAVIIGVAAVVQTFVETAGPHPALPKDSLLLAAVALLLAHCSLGSIWWARSTWPSYAKTLVIALASALLWLLLVGVLETTRLSDASAAGWALAIATQTLLAAGGATFLEFRLSPSLRSARSRYTIMFLLLWMAVVGVLLGAGRSLATRLGWTWAGIRGWEFHDQLQTLAVSNAVLSVGVLAAIRVPRDATIRAFAVVLCVFVSSLLFPGLMTAYFGKKLPVGFAELFWLVLYESAFLLAALVPLEAEGETAKAI